MSLSKQFLHPIMREKLKQLGYNRREINWIGMIVNRYTYLGHSDKSFCIQERHALDWMIKKTIDFSIMELRTGVLEDDSKMQRLSETI